MTSRGRNYLLGLGAILVVTLVAIGATGRQSRASLGNRGVPVYGRLAGPVPEGDTYAMKFTAADGTPFNDSKETVPDGYYLLITDITMTTDGGRDAAAVVSLDLKRTHGASSLHSLRLRSTDNETLHLNYTTPHFVLEPGDGLEATNAWYSDKWAYVNVSGLLVHSVTYLPLVAR